MSEKQTKEAAPLTEELLKKKEADLKTQSEKLAQDRKDFEKEKENFEKEKQDFQKSKDPSKESESITDFEFEGEIYSFSEKAPEVINYAGQKFTRQELVDNEEVLLQFIGGRSTLIIKK